MLKLQQCPCLLQQLSLQLCAAPPELAAPALPQSPSLPAACSNACDTQHPLPRCTLPHSMPPYPPGPLPSRSLRFTTTPSRPTT